MAIESHIVRHKDGKPIKVKNYSIQRAVKLMCTECLGLGQDPGIKEAVEDCCDKLCPLHPFRGSYVPKRMTDEEREAAAVGLKQRLASKLT